MFISDNNSDPIIPSFTDSFFDFLATRCEQVMKDQVSQNQDFLQSRDEINQASIHICGLLNDSQKHYFYALESAEGMSLSIAVRIIYQQGITDGLRLGKILEIK